MREVKKMRTTIVAGCLLAMAAVAWLRAQGQPFPGPGTGIMNVAGTVNVGNRPGVTAAQEGEWKVAVANAPDVRVSNVPTVLLAPLPFIKPGTRYVITWPNAEVETITVVEMWGGAWVRTAASPNRPGQWVNLTVARAVGEAR
jgi:hypothetical protein